MSRCALRVIAALVVVVSLWTVPASALTFEEVHGNLTFEEWFGLKDWFKCMFQTGLLVYHFYDLGSFWGGTLLLLELIFIEFVLGLYFLIFNIIANLCSGGAINLWQWFIPVAKFFTDLIFDIVEALF
ncbi:MAG: hypothetical protein II954_01880 [Synergistaceae bacterium]|nr:hypothetical protein [Synergistaceae bacterium]